MSAAEPGGATGAPSDGNVQPAATSGATTTSGGAVWQTAPSSAPPAAWPSSSAGSDAGSSTKSATTTKGASAGTSSAASTWGTSGSWLDQAADDAQLTLKAYGDVGYSLRDNTRWEWASENVPAGVPGAFQAAHLDLFGSASVGKLSFLTEVMFEPEGNAMGVDVERLQVMYLFANWLRVHAGRTHLAWGYYNDTYHHGNIFELTSGRPYSVSFEDGNGLILAHNVGAGLDGTIDAGSAGSFRYDAEIGNGRPADITSVGLQFAEKTEPLVNVRLRWMPTEGLIFGVNGMRDVVPALDSTVVASRPEATELAGGVHAVYTEHHVIADLEGFAVRHSYADGTKATITRGAFAELGYNIGEFTPYVRPEYIRFPAAPDLVYQYGATSAQASQLAGGAPTGPASPYVDTRSLFDLRVGLKWMPFQQLALKLELERLSHDSQHQEIVTTKVAFGF